MAWFQSLFGFAEADYKTTQAAFELQGSTLVTHTQPPRRFEVGAFSTPSLRKLREDQPSRSEGTGVKLKLQVTVGDVSRMLCDAENRLATFQVCHTFCLPLQSRHFQPGVEAQCTARFSVLCGARVQSALGFIAVMPPLEKQQKRGGAHESPWLLRGIATGNHSRHVQVASQFNALEFVHAKCTPEDGIGGYERDRTQGPACSIACGPATVVRNYFVPVSTGNALQRGQSAEHQLNNADDLLARLGCPAEEVRVTNGYMMASDEGLRCLAAAIEAGDREALTGALKVGVHADVQVRACGRYRMLNASTLRESLRCRSVQLSCTIALRSCAPCTGTPRAHSAPVGAVAMLCRRAARARVRAGDLQLVGHAPSWRPFTPGHAGLLLRLPRQLQPQPGVPMAAHCGAGVGGCVRGDAACGG